MAGWGGGRVGGQVDTSCQNESFGLRDKKARQFFTSESFCMCTVCKGRRSKESHIGGNLRWGDSKWDLRESKGGNVVGEAGSYSSLCWRGAGLEAVVDDACYIRMANPPSFQS